MLFCKLDYFEGSGKQWAIADKIPHEIDDEEREINEVQFNQQMELESDKIGNFDDFKSDYHQNLWQFLHQGNWKQEVSPGHICFYTTLVNDTGINVSKSILILPSMRVKVKVNGTVRKISSFQDSNHLKYWSDIGMLLNFMEIT